MNITLHRGSNEIGGTCIELEESGTRLILDLGIPLTRTGGGEFDKKDLDAPTVANGLLPDIKGLYAWDTPGVTAVLLSHAHLDHYGLMDFIHPEIPVYLNPDTKAIIEVGNVFWREDMKQLKLLSHIEEFKNGRDFSIAPFTISPFLVDHSSYGASAFLIESDGKKVFYSGDIRAHGNKESTFDALLVEPKIKQADVLFIEGTTLGPGHAGALASEEDVFKQFTQVFKNQEDASFVLAAGSNIDRTVSLFKATHPKRTDKKLVIDLYQYYMLCKLKSIRPGSKMPPFHGDHIRIYYNNTHRNKIVANFEEHLLSKYWIKRIEQDEIVSRRKDLVLRLSLWDMERLANAMLKDAPLNKAKFIYSMWEGYLKKDNKITDFYKHFKMTKTDIHCSGHAYKPDLIKLIKAINPKQLCSVHTLNADELTKEIPGMKIVNKKTIKI